MKHFEDDERDLMELIHLAAYLEDQSERGLFPKARFKRYSDVLDRLIRYLAYYPGNRADFDDPNEPRPPGVVADRPRKPSGRPFWCRP